MKAKYNSKTPCPVCRKPIKAGEYMGRAKNQWAHKNCAAHHDRSLSLKLRCAR